MLQNILVSRLRFMGDIILTTPLLGALRQHYPKARITYLTEAPYSELLINHPWVDEVIALPGGGILEEFSCLQRLIRTRFDLAIDLFGNPRSALLTFLSGAPRRIGGNFRGRRHFYTDTIRDDGKPKTAVEFHLRDLEPLGFQGDSPRTYIEVTDAEKNWARGYLEKMGLTQSTKLIGIHPGASWPAKRWFPERFALLADRLALEQQAQIVVTMGPGEEQIMQEISQLTTSALFLPEVLPLRKLSALLSRFDLYISNDCGPMHLAPAVGTPVIGIFGPGEPEIWFPYPPDEGNRLVRAQLPCSRCGRDFCDDLICMKSVSVDMVLSAVMDSLGAIDAGRL